MAYFSKMGTELPADEVSFATGYENMRGTARKIFGRSWQNESRWPSMGFDEGELRTVWRQDELQPRQRISVLTVLAQRSGHPGFGSSEGIWLFAATVRGCC